jgi:hypothetical protein
MSVKTRLSSASDLITKIVSAERSFVLPSTFNSDKHEALSIHIETVHLNGICTVGLIKPPVEAINKLNEDVTQIKRRNALLIARHKN